MRRRAQRRFQIIGGHLYGLLKQDHRQVESLLEQYRAATANSKQALLGEITRELEEEEEIFPMMLESLSRSRLEDLGKEIEDAKKSAKDVHRDRP